MTNNIDQQRLAHLCQFYESLDALAKKSGIRTLNECHGRMDWPARGIYFFFDTNEPRVDTGRGNRVVRVGTHALTSTSRTTLWNRLSQHKGRQHKPGGNHRGSVFRKLVGQSLIAKDGLNCGSWGVGNNAPREVRVAEQPIEAMVSDYIGALPFVWLDIDDAPGPNSNRGYIERNAISLLSNRDKTNMDDSTPGWMGHYSDRERVRTSGLWNQNHVDETYDPDFLDTMRSLI